jgi:hypothetical protein
MLYPVYASIEDYLAQPVNTSIVPPVPPYPASLLISRSWNLSGVVAAEFEQTSGDEGSGGLALLNGLLAFRSVRTDLIPYWGRIEFNLVQGQERYYIPNLLAVETFTFNIGVVRFPTFSAGRRQYFGDGRVDNIQALPFEWHVERAWGGAYLYVYYLPDQNYVAKISGKFGLQNVQLQTNLATIYDDFYIEYLRFCLAEYMDLEYDITFPEDKLRMKMQMEHALRWVSPPDLHMKKIGFMNKDRPFNWAHANISPGYSVG